MSELKYYTISAAAGIFVDPLQPDEENKKLLPGQVKPLVTTRNVTERKKGGHIVAVDKADYDEYVAKKKAAEQEEAAIRRTQSKSLSNISKEIGKINNLDTDVANRAASQLAEVDAKLEKLAELESDVSTKQEENRAVLKQIEESKEEILTAKKEVELRAKAADEKLKAAEEKLKKVEELAAQQQSKGKDK